MPLSLRTPWPARVAAMALALACAWAGAPALAQPATDAGDTGDIEHLVVPGDTLEALARHYLDDATQWPPLARINHVANPRRLVPGSTLRIPHALLPYAPATVDYVRGPVQATMPVAPADTRSTAPANVEAGQRLPEGSVLHVPPDSFISVRLADGSIIRVQAGSNLHLERLRKHARPGSAQSVIELQRGAVEPSVTPSTDGTRRLDIRTPKATASVRGTRFWVEAGADGRTLTAVQQGTVAVQGIEPKARETLLPHGQGVAVDATGHVGTPATLLAAPDLSRLPAAVHDADFLRLALPTAPGASAWQVQVAQDAGMTQIVRAATSATPTLTLPAVPDGRYQIAVRLLDAQGLPGLSAQRALTVKAHPVPPLYQSPDKDAVVDMDTLRFACTRVAEAGRYRIQVAARADFAQPLLDVTSDGACTANAPQLQTGRYAWRVASLRQLADGQWDQGPWAAPQGFAVAPRPLAADAFQPAQSATGETTLSWPAQAGQTFRLQVADSADFSHPLVDQTLTQPTWSAGALPAGRYHVRLRTIDPSGLESAFSTPYLLTVLSRIDSGSGQAITTGAGTPLQRP